MKATAKNRKNKIERHKKIKEGNCIFPFTYKRKVHKQCFETEDGPICATEINSKTGVLSKYGYCVVDTTEPVIKEADTNVTESKKTPPNLGKGTEEKALPIEKQKTIKLKSKTPPKAKTIKKLNYKLKLVEKTPTPKKEDIKISPEVKIEKEKMSVTSPEAKRYNEEFISILGELNDIMIKQGEPFRAKAYGKAQETIMTINEDITELSQLKGKPGLGTTIMDKLKEYIETGTLKVLERERQNPFNILTNIYGVGPKKAQELIKKGITSIEQLRLPENKDLLNDKQKIGLKYYEDIQKRIPRSEIDEYKKLFEKYFPTSEESKFEIVGSYRRGLSDSGDIDIIITNSKNDASVYKNFVDSLVKNKIILEVLSTGESKTLVIAKIDDYTPRRLDFLYSPPDEFAFSLLYFTGSKIFNTIQRQRALDLGYTLNEHGFHNIVSGKKGTKVEQAFPDEKSIFDFLGMVYKEPEQRKDGRAFQLKTDKKIDEAQVPKAQQIQVHELQAQHIESVKEETEQISKEQTQAQEQEVKLQQANEQAKQVVAEKKSGPKKTTIKKKLVLKEKDNNLEKFKKEGLSTLKMMTEAELSKLITDANDAYYCKNKPIMSDNEYDIVREYTLQIYPNNEAAKEGHTKCKVDKNKVKLPYQMWSMDKIKPDTDALAKWVAKYKGPYVLSCKLDGVSGLYVYNAATKKAKLYTRGDGIIGQDVSHIIPYLKLSNAQAQTQVDNDLALRGEFIIKKDLFKEKYGKEFANPRNFVAGLINQKTPQPEKYKDLSFVVYEVIQPILKPSEQMKFVETTLQDVELVKYEVHNKISNELLSQTLINWRASYDYEIDGIICINDEIYPRPKGNPDYAFAFKMVLSEQVAEAKVVDVLWAPSKDGYLKPRVQIEPINLGGVMIEYATGFNAKFIEDNSIGVGSLIRLIRSGDVIPHITEVIQPATEPLFPQEPYEWNATHVDIILKNKEENFIVKQKNITGFFKSIGVEGLSTGNVTRIMESGYSSVPEIIALTEQDLLKVPGFKKKMASKIYEGIKEKINSVSLPELMHATNIFGRGFGTKKIEAILTDLPLILVDESSKQEKIKKVIGVQGLAKKTAEQFVNQLEEFIEFMKVANLKNKLTYTPKKPDSSSVNKEHLLYKKKFVLTGFRDKELVAKLEALGAEQASAVSKNTNLVIAKSIDEDTGKVAEAKKLGIEIVTPEMLKEKYGL